MKPKIIRAHARRTDPETSHQAAEKIDVRETQQHVLRTLQRSGACTDEELIEQYEYYDYPKQSPSGIRSRRNELVKLGRVEWTGEWRVMTTGSRARVWVAKD